MPAAKLFLDFDTRKFVDSSGTAVVELTGKKGSIREYELAIVQDGTPMTMPEGATVDVALKKTSAAAGDLLTQVSAARSGWGTGTRWVFKLDLTDERFDTVLGTKVDFEVRLELPDGQVIPSRTVPFTIEKNVMLDDGGS